MHKIEVQEVATGQESNSHVFRALAGKADDISRRAFDLFKERGAQYGHPDKDWLQAEKQILGGTTAELSEDEVTYNMRIALPGFGPDEIEVAASSTEVVVHASMSKSAPQSRATILWTEIETTDTFRQFQLPRLLEAGKVTAILANGMLQIVAPKAGAAGIPAAKSGNLGASGACDPKCKNGCASASTARNVHFPLVS
jgi:HSP20 family molecular chaperone IbpA